MYCLNGTLIENTSLCGCPINEILKDDECVSKYAIGPKELTLNYIFKGKTRNINFTVYKGLNDYLAGLDRSISYYDTPPEDIDFLMRDLNNEFQKDFLDSFIDEIRKLSDNKQEQAKIAISIVQNIPYGFGASSGKYPYEVLYTKRGVCGEKSKLLVYLLRELGFKTSVLRFNEENHDAVGIGCTENFDYKDTGYCFVETTTPSIITDSEGDYVGVGKLSSDPVILKVSGGIILEDVKNEYNDASELNILESKGTYLSPSDYSKWEILIKKYGIQIKEN